MRFPGFLVCLLAASCGWSSASDAPIVSDPLRPRQGDFVESITLSGELDAARNDEIAVPRLPNWQTSIKWIIADGSEVKKGDRVVDLDNSAFTSDLEQKRLAAGEAARQLAQKDAESQADLSEKEFDVAKRKQELEKATIAADVPADILPRRQLQERQLALERARTELAKAEATLAAARRAAEAERSNFVLALAKSERDVVVAETAIRELSLHAPRDGIVVVGDIPWEGRKLQTGDAVWVGFTLARIPELSTLQVVANLSDVDDGKVVVGDPAAITLDAYPDTSYTGKVVEVAPVAQEEGRFTLRRFFRVKVALDERDFDRMRPGFSVKARVLRRRMKDVLLAPRLALDLLEKPPKARLVNNVRVPVQLGPCNAQECVVEKGLTIDSRLHPIGVSP